MKIIYSIIIVSFLCLNCFGQISFQKLYKMNDSIHWDEGVSVQQNISTGGYLISGTTFNNVSSRASIILINTNNYGDTTSTYTYEADTALLFCVGTKELSS